MNIHWKTSIALASLAWTATHAGAAEITLIAPGGIRAAIVAMIPDFERRTFSA